MLKHFFGYYRPTPEQLTEIWNQAVFSFDTNILLNVYRYEAATRERFFQVLTLLRDRIWIPHQVALEYQDQRVQVIFQQANVYDKLGRLSDEFLKKLENELQGHPFIDQKKLFETASKAVRAAKELLDEGKQKHPNLLESDPFRDTITQLFEGKVGEPYSESRLEEIHKDAKKRYERLEPPGFRDTTKSNVKPYGDLVLWYQLLDFAKSANKPMIFVTEDQTEDWWQERDGKIIGPRPELRQEMKSKAGVDFYMYQTDRFLEFAEKHLGLTEEKSVMEDVRKVRQREEAIQRLAFQRRLRADVRYAIALYGPSVEPRYGARELARFISSQMWKKYSREELEGWTEQTLADMIYLELAGLGGRFGSWAKLDEELARESEQEDKIER